MSQSQLQSQIQQISTNPDVLGVVVADMHGLCMAATGVLLPSSSGHIHSILDVASKLSEEGEHPIIHIQTMNNDILITHTDNYTTGIARNAPFSIAQPAAAPVTPAVEAGAPAE